MTLNALRTSLACAATAVALVSVAPTVALAQTPDTTTRVVTQPVEDDGVDLGWIGLLGLAGLLGLRRPAPVVHHETVRPTTGTSDPGMRR